jgi:formyl-CoA transferase/CoA:oxalate CoA-transferase
LSVPYQAYLASDDWLVIAAFNHKMWLSFCDVVERPQWAIDPRFATPEARAGHRDELIDLIGQLIAKDTAANWEDTLIARGVPATIVNKLDKVVAHEQVAARDMIVEMQSPSAGPIKMAGLPIKFSQTPGSLRSAPPALGAETRAVLARAGYSAAEIEHLAKAGTIGLGDNQ